MSRADRVISRGVIAARLEEISTVVGLFERFGGPPIEVIRAMRARAEELEKAVEEINGTQK